jgi:multidrug efflux pump subunit AcrA (membrane-fusion protein)
MMKKTTAGGVILAVLCALIFFSKTIYTYNLPEVRGVKPFRGTLSKLEVTQGVASWTEAESLYAQTAGTIAGVLVREGQAVRQGEPLCTLSFDRAETERKLQETVNNREKLWADIQNTEAKLRELDAALDFGDESSLIGIELAQAARALEDASLLFEFGSASQRDRTVAEEKLRTARLVYEQQRSDLRYTLQTRQLDLENLRLAEEGCRESLREYQENAVIAAPADGVVLSVKAEKGMFVPAHTFLVSIGMGNSFTLECPVPLSNNFILPGDSCTLSNSSHTLTGTVTRVASAAQGKTVRVSLTSDDITAGETFEVRFEKESPAVYTLVPNSALNQDNNGTFLYQIKRRDGMMGKEYYVERLDVYAGDSDSQNTAIVQGITFFEPLVLSSSAFLSPGDTVLLQNAEDFFEN